MYIYIYVFPNSLLTANMPILNSGWDVLGTESETSSAIPVTRPDMSARLQDLPRRDVLGINKDPKQVTSTDLNQRMYHSDTWVSRHSKVHCSELTGQRVLDMDCGALHQDFDIGMS